MSTTTVTSVESPVPLRMRQDLLCRAQRVGDSPYWCIKDPISLEYFHLKDEEFGILKMLDGKATLGDIESKFHKLFAPLKTDAAQLRGFFEMLLQNDLVVSDVPQFDRALIARSRERERRAKRQAFTNVLAIRFRGVDPDKFLGWLHDCLQWALRPWFFVFSVLLVAVAVGIVAVRFDALRQSLPTLSEFLTIDNVALLAVSLAVVKILHELAHGIACKHYGGECHELGLMLLVFTPCLYCDVSDMWMEPSKWRRIIVSAAGIWAELLIAAVCTIVWSLSQPGLLHTLCLNVMLVASVNTLLFNGNFLRRYDGYYIFSDLVEVPNLAQRAQTFAKRMATRLVFGAVPNETSPREERPVLLVVYGIASTLYLWFLMFAILWFCHGILKPHGLRPLVDVLAVATVLGVVVPGSTHATKFVRRSVAQGRVSKLRMYGTLIFLAVLGWGIAVFPWPYNLDAVAALEPSGAKTVYATVPGVIQPSVKLETVVERDQVIAVLDNPDLNRDLERLRGSIRETLRQIKNAEARILVEPAAAKEVPTLNATLKDFEQQLAQRVHDEAELTIRAPIAGTVLPPPYRLRPASGSAELPTWSGFPLDEANRGCYIEPGTAICLIGTPNNTECRLLVDETQMPFVSVGQKVEVQFEERPGVTYHAEVTEVSADRLTNVPRELSHSRLLPVHTDETGQTHPLENVYQVRATFTDAPDGLLKLRTTGRAKLIGPRQSLATRANRYLRRTFGTQW